MASMGCLEAGVYKMGAADHSGGRLVGYRCGHFHLPSDPPTGEALPGALYLDPHLPALGPAQSVFAWYGLFDVGVTGFTSGCSPATW